MGDITNCFTIQIFLQCKKVVWQASQDGSMALTSTGNDCDVYIVFTIFLLKAN